MAYRQEINDSASAAKPHLRRVITGSQVAIRPPSPLYTAPSDTATRMRKMSVDCCELLHPAVSRVSPIGERPIVPLGIPRPGCQKGESVEQRHEDCFCHLSRRATGWRAHVGREPPQQEPCPW